MTRPSRTFSTRDTVAPDALAAALQPTFGVRPGPVRTVAKTWLDTFDWRLHDAGISLEYTDDGPLTMHLPDGSRRQCPLPARHWPVLLADLPAGPLRDALAPVVTPRALVPVVTVHCTVRESRVLNADGKTVARLVVESDDDGATRLLVQPLRGYAGEADQISRRLADFDGLTPVATTPYDHALAHAGRKPGDYDKNPTVPLRPDTPAPVAVASVLRHFAAGIDANIEGTIADIDTEFLHDLRVAVRRTRSILKLTGDVLPGDLAARYEPEFTWLGDLTTRLRDLDVFLLKVGDMASALTSAAPVDLDPFRSFLVRRRAAERRRLVRGLRSRRFDKLMQAWRSELAEVTAGAGGGQPIVAVADQRLRRAFRRVGKRGTRITADSPGEEVHALRKRCKELRYLLEVFRPLCAETAHRRLVKELKALQDTLGEFQDGEVQRQAVREYAAAMMAEGAAPPETVLAMGELAAQLDARQLKARAELAGRLRPFLAEKARVKALVRR
ncbi:MAG: CHAD domain-containing protein [Mycobacterium sp.]|uniref:CYTH and CHAD domain-containing protein n=1 Tax=Mycobacterium sp. TaxID=1785 RepID=UPI002613F739|nr:CHAD domain-containing protein [Mycobacterium sp.]MDI3313287.1 CHAD domain-containing protein [Mycobacterium sp.]